MPSSNASSERPDVILAVSYAAKSTTDAHDSIPTQQEAIRRRAEQHLGRLIAGEFAESNRSGFRGNRGPQLEAALERAVELAETNAHVELWVWHSSRLGRGSGLKGEARSLLEVFTFLRRRGVTLRSVDDDQFVTSPMLIGFAAEQAQKYSADLSGWVTAGKERQWQRGDWIGGPIPDGYMSDGERGIALDPQRAPVIRAIFERALDGGAPPRIARELNAEGIRTKADGAWTRRRVQDTLSNAIYAGQLVRWRGTEREQRKRGRHPAILSEDELAAVAELARKRDAAAAGRAQGGRPSPGFCWRRWRAAAAAAPPCIRAPRPTGARMACAGARTCARTSWTARGCAMRPRSTPRESTRRCSSACRATWRPPTAGCASWARIATTPRRPPTASWSSLSSACASWRRAWPASETATRWRRRPTSGPRGRRRCSTPS